MWAYLEYPDYKGAPEGVFRVIHILRGYPHVAKQTVCEGEIYFLYVVEG